MRQAGILAAGALYAFRNNIRRLEEDHTNAGKIAQAIRETSALELEYPNPPTNLVWFKVNSKMATGDEFAALLKKEGVLVSQAGPQVCRAVTHLDATGAKVATACDAIRKVAGLLEAGKK